MKSVLLHPQVASYLDSLEPKERARCYAALKHLEEDPFTGRSGCDIKKLQGRGRAAYRLRVGEHRFAYVVIGEEVLVEDAFRRGREY